MNITLGIRTAETVAIYFHQTNNASIHRVLPQKAKTAEEAIADYEKTLLPGATSYGKTILLDGRYVGDVWCYCIDPADTPNAMVSYCVFEQAYWGRGVATQALKMFISDASERYHLRSLGAFTFADHLPSIRVLEKCGFTLEEEFVEGGVLSRYYQLNL